jgi:hypothetical protein
MAPDLRLRGDALFVPGDPPRTSVVALHGAHGTPADPTAADGDVDLVVESASGPRRRTVPAHVLTMDRALPALLDPDRFDPASPTQRFWAAVATFAVHLVARGRLLPAISGQGYDAWRVGPLDVEDSALLAALAAACPPQAHAVPVPGRRPLLVRSPEELIAACCDAVADTLVRTAAAPVAAARGAFATSRPIDVSHLRGWLSDMSHGVDGGARAGLRIEPVAPDSDLLHAVIQLRSRVDPSLVVDAADLWQAPAAVLARMGDDAEADLLLGLRRGARAWPPLEPVLRTAAPTELPLDDEALADLLGGGGEALASAGVELLWPSELFTDDVRIRAVAESLGSDAEPTFSLDTLLQFRWEVAVGGEALTEDELSVLAEAKRPLVRLRGRWVRVDAATLARLRRRRESRGLSGIDALAAALTGRLDVDGDTAEFVATDALADLAGRLRAVTAQHDGSRTAPAGLSGVLRPYQLRGLDWLTEMADLGLGGCLADDMGLGKTVQLIALHLRRHEDGTATGPTLVVCPTSLLGNWEREIRRFAPGIPVRRFHGGDRHVDEVAKDEIVLATYGLVRRDRDTLGEVPWGMVAADEAQHAKNPVSRTARALRSIHCPVRVALTGTPVENRLSDLWSILDWTTPGLLGPLDRFRRTVAVPVERYHDEAATERLARLVRPFLLRRKKSDPGIAPELPAKTETDRIVPLTAEQATLYEAVVRETLTAIRKARGIERRGLVLKLLTGLKQVCNHPAQYLGQDSPLAGRSGKLAALDELTEVIVAEGESVLVFTQYVVMGRLLEAHLASRGIPTYFLHGSVPARRREEMVDLFQRGAVPVFLLSLKAGGTGLNLTRATHVIHYDRWWNPAVEDQATDRAHRIGQDRPVQVHRLMTEGTLEDRIAAVMERKRALADAVVGGGEAWLTELSDDELSELVALRDSE